MPPSLPAVRAYPEKRHPDLGVDIRDGLAPPSPGVGYDELDDQGGLTFLTTATPVQTTRFIVNTPASDIGNKPTPTTVVQVSTSFVIVVASEGPSLPASVHNSTLPAVTNTSDIIASSSSTSLSTLPPPSPPIPATTDRASRPTTTSPAIQGPVSGSTIVPSPSLMSPSDAFLTNSESGMKKPRGLSGGVIAAIVIILLLAFSAVAFFVFRNRRIQKRVARRVTWTTGLSQIPNFDSLEKGPSHVHPTSSHEPTGSIEQSPTGQGSAQGEAQAPVRNIPRKPPLPYSPVSSLTPPLPSYNNPPHVAVPYVPQATTPTQDSASVQDVPMLVRVTFVPQLPDELAITPGETLYIRTEYDDGWALCVNTRGNQGMVPVECLEGDGGQLTAPSLVGNWRTSRRASSLRSVATWS